MIRSARDINTKHEEGKLLIAAIYLLQEGNTELKGQPTERVLEQLQVISDAVTG